MQEQAFIKKKFNWKYIKKEGINFGKGMFYLFPTLALMLIFTIYPLFNTFMISFKEYYNYLDDTFVSYGLQNYKYVLTDPNYMSYLGNTMIITFVSVPLTIAFSLLISVALNSIKVLQRFLQTLYFLPYVTNTIAIGMVFAVMFEPQTGLINSILRTLGMDAINWLGGEMLYGEVANPSKISAMFVLIFYIVWNSLPFKILIFMSALQSIDKQYYQAAQIDSTPKWRVFTKITVPLLSPQILYLMITSFIGSFKEYTSIISIFGPEASWAGDQTHSMATVVWYVYDMMAENAMVIKIGEEVITYSGVSYAAAGAFVLFIIILLFTAIQNFVSKKRVHY